MAGCSLCLQFLHSQLPFLSAKLAQPTRNSCRGKLTLSFLDSDPDPADEPPLYSFPLPALLDPIPPPTAGAALGEVEGVTQPSAPSPSSSLCVTHS